MVPTVVCAHVRNTNKQAGDFPQCQNLLINNFLDNPAWLDGLGRSKYILFILILITYVNSQLAYYTLIIIVNISIFYQSFDHHLSIYITIYIICIHIHIHLYVSCVTATEVEETRSLKGPQGFQEAWEAKAGKPTGV